MGWERKTWRFTATRAKTTLEFASDGRGDELMGAALDNVAVFSLGAFEEEGGVVAATRERIGRLIKQLGDRDVMKREEASQALVESGLVALDQLEQACSSSDAEIRRRAELAIDGIERALAEKGR